MPVINVYVKWSPHPTRLLEVWGMREQPLQMSSLTAITEVGQTLQHYNLLAVMPFNLLSPPQFNPDHQRPQVLRRHAATSPSSVHLAITESKMPVNNM